MMTNVRLTIALLSIGFASAGFADDSVTDVKSAQTIEFGGLREARAIVEMDRECYVVAVEMLPVHVFDATTNRSINRRLLTHLAFDAVRQILSNEPVSLTISGAIVGNLEAVDVKCRLSVRVPRDGIEIGPAAETETRQVQDVESLQPESGARVVWNSSLDGPQAGLLERKQAYLDLLDGLVEELEAERVLLTVPPDRQDADGESAKPDSLAKRATSLFQALSRHIETDLLLLSIEKQSLLDDLQIRERELLTAIRRTAIPRPCPPSPENDHEAHPALVPDDHPRDR